MPYQYLEDITTADVAFKAWADSIEGLYREAAEATIKVMADRIDLIEPKQTRVIELEEDDEELLLFQFLQELIYYKDAEELLLKSHQIEYSVREGRYFVTAVMRGEVLDPPRHQFMIDIKAITIHQFQLKKTDQGWECLVIVDV